MSEELRLRMVAALTELAKGYGATIPALQMSQDLVTLESVIADASGGGASDASLDQVATSLRRFLAEAANTLEAEPTSQKAPNRSRAALALLGVDPTVEGRAYRAVKARDARQPVVARWLDKPREAIDKKRRDGTTPVTELIDAVAAQLVLRENEYLIDERRLAQRARRTPLETAMRVEWLDRFERYFRMWSPLSGLHHDIEMSIESRGSPVDIELFGRKSLYYFCSFLVERERFLAETSGLWVLPDVTTEDAIADSTWFARAPGPFGEVAESILEKAYDEAPRLAEFLHVTYSDQRMHPFVERWFAWLETCRCARPKHPRKDCKVHNMSHWCRFYMDALEQQWDFIADWYKQPRVGTKVDPVKSVRSGKLTWPPKLKSRQTGNDGVV